MGGLIDLSDRCDVGGERRTQVAQTSDGVHVDVIGVPTPALAHSLAAALAMLAAGLVDAGDLCRLGEQLADPTVIDIPQVTFAAWDRRPGSG